MVAVPREQCFAMSGTVELPVEDGIPPATFPPPKYGIPPPKYRK
jgi:hypothetical protein